MSEKILKALMRLFSIIAKANENSTDARNIVESYLKQQLNAEQVIDFLALYDVFLKSQDEGADGEKKRRRLAVSSVKVIVICEQINEELTQKQKFIVLLNLIEFVSFSGSISEQEMEFVSTVSSSFNIQEDELNQCIQLALKNSIAEIEDSSNFLFAGKQKEESKIKSTLKNLMPDIKINSPFNSLLPKTLPFLGTDKVNEEIPEDSTKIVPP